MNVYTSAQVCACVCVCTRRAHGLPLPMCSRHSPLSISNEQPVNEGGPCSLHSTSREIITRRLKPFSICSALTASFSRHLYENPILPLSFFQLLASTRAVLLHLHTSTYLERDKTGLSAEPCSSFALNMMN